MGTKKILSGTEIRALALAAYDAEVEAGADVSLGLSPAKAVKLVSEEAGRDALSIVSLVYFRENGRRNPLPATAAKTTRSLRVAVRNRRDAGGTLGRWETVAASAEATLGRPVSEKEAKAIYSAVADLDASYTGRGTRVAAPKTYADPAVAVAPKK